MKRTRRNGSGVPALTPAEALGMLASAITYLQQSGLTVKAGNDSRLGLVLAIDGARVTADSFGVMRFEPMPVAPGPVAQGQASTPDVASTPPAEAERTRTAVATRSAG